METTRAESPPSPRPPGDVPPSAPGPGPALPRVLRLPPHHSLLRRAPTSRQFGLDPRTALAVDDLSPPLALMLDELAAPAERVDLVARAVRRGADAHAAEDLLRRLVAAGAVVDAAAVERARRRRRESAVAVDGTGPLAAGVAAGLALAGIGTVHVAAASDRLVHARDLGTGLLDADRGRPRAEALVDAVRRVVPGARVGPAPARAVPDLHVLADAAAPDPVRVAQLHRERVGHLGVRLRDGTGVVGPLVLPGRSACLGCVELQRTARDPGWAAVAARLVDVEGSGEPATAAATAALAVAQVLAALDGAVTAPACAPAPPTLGATLELDLVTGVLLRRAWSVHPDCTCGAPPAQTCGQDEGRGTIVG